MANVPADLRYTKEHEWARLEGDKARVGITAFAQPCRLANRFPSELTIMPYMFAALRPRFVPG